MRFKSRRKPIHMLTRRYSDGSAQVETVVLNADSISEKTPLVGAEETTTEQKEEKQDTEAKKEGKVYSRDEVNKIIAAERARALESYKAEQTEAEKLSKMKQDERLQYEKEQADKKAAEALAELNAYKLRDEAVKVAGESQLPLEFLELFDFHAMTAEEVKERISSTAKAFHTVLETALNAKLGQKSPITVLDKGKQESEGVRLAETIGKKRADGNKQSESVLEHYLGGN